MESSSRRTSIATTPKSRRNSVAPRIMDSPGCT
jgi:hypothetical protein